MYDSKTLFPRFSKIFARFWLNWLTEFNDFKGSPYPTPFIFSNQCRTRSDPTQNDSEFLSSINFGSILKFNIHFLSRSMSDPTLSDIDFKNKMAWVWTTLIFPTHIELEKLFQSLAKLRQPRVPATVDEISPNHGRDQDYDKRTSSRCPEEKPSIIPNQYCLGATQKIAKLGWVYSYHCLF